MKATEADAEEAHAGVFRGRLGAFRSISTRKYSSRRATPAPAIDECTTDMTDDECAVDGVCHLALRSFKCGRGREVSSSNANSPS